VNRSVQDLIEALRRDEDSPVDVAAVIAGAQRRARQRRTRQRRLLVVLAGAAVIGLALAPTILASPRHSGVLIPAETSSSHSTGPTPARLRGVLESTLQPSTAGPWRIVPFSTGDWVQTGYVRRTDRTTWVHEVDIYEPGAFDPGSLTGSTPATVHGQPAYGRIIDGHQTLTWQYAPGAWAVITGESGSSTMDALRQVAEGVVLGRPGFVRLPFRLGYVPAGLHAVTADVYGSEHHVASIAFDSDTEPYRNWRDSQRHQWDRLHVSIQDAIAHQWRPDTTIGGVPAMRNGSDYIIQRDGYWLTIGCGDRVGSLPVTEVARVLGGLTMADWHAPATWFDAIYP
jgi:hypothetical protein